MCCVLLMIKLITIVFNWGRNGSSECMGVVIWGGGTGAVVGSAGCCDWGGTGAVEGSVVLSGTYWYTLGNVK